MGVDTRPVFNATKYFVSLQIARDILKYDDGSDQSSINELLENASSGRDSNLLNGKLIFYLKIF